MKDVTLEDDSVRNDSKSMLAWLDQANLFLVRLDTCRQWFRYHHLFAELLKLELDAERQANVHDRASAWFEANGTVRAHCSTIYGKLGTKNRTQAIMKAKEAGLL